MGRRAAGLALVIVVVLAALTVPQLAGRVGGLGLITLDLSELLQSASISPGNEPRVPQCTAADLAALIYTSGTSGLPKGVPLTHGNLQSNVDAAIEHMSFQSSHTFLGILPLFHVFGLSAMMLAPIQLGATIVYMARFSPVGALNAIREHKASLMFGTPSMYAAMLRLKDAGPEDFSQIYAMISGAEPLPATTLLGAGATASSPGDRCGFRQTDSLVEASATAVLPGRAGSAAASLAWLRWASSAARWYRSSSARKLPSE